MPEIIEDTDDSMSDEEGFGDMFPDQAQSEQESSQKRKDPPSSADKPSPAKKRKLKKANELMKLKRPATVEELNRLKETENLFHSNLFRRQIEEMLKEIELKKKFVVRVNAWFEKFSNLMLGMKESGESHALSDLNWLSQKKVKYPLNVFETSNKGQYQFKKPSRIKLIGSYSLKTMVDIANVDIALEMPNDFYGNQDHLNGRYFRKRALYLCDISSYLRGKKEVVDSLEFGCVDGDNWRPYLRVTPAGKLSKSTKFIVHLVPEKGSFRLNRFSLTRNNVRPSWFFDDVNKEQYNGKLFKNRK